jgi:hypothetical protein
MRVTLSDAKGLTRKRQRCLDKLGMTDFSNVYTFKS